MNNVSSYWNNKSQSVLETKVMPGALDQQINYLETQQGHQRHFKSRMSFTSAKKTGKFQSDRSPKRRNKYKSDFEKLKNKSSVPSNPIW